MGYARADLVVASLENLGILYQPDSSATRTRLEWVTETLANLGVIQQAYSGTTRTRIELVTEALANLGIIQQAYSGGTRTRAELVTEALAKLGVIQKVYFSPINRTRAELVTEALARLGIVQQAFSGSTHTRVALINNVLEILGVLAAGQTADPDDVNAVDERVVTTLADLNNRQIVTITDPNAIPDQWFDAVSAILAEVCKQKFGVTGQQATDLVTAANAAETRLSVTTQLSIVDEIIPSMLADLEARMVVIVTDPAVIPTQYFPELAALLADQVRNKFKITSDLAQRVMADAAKAEKDLKTTTRLSIVDELIPSMLADLSARMVVTVADPASIPTQYFPELAAILADSVRNKFEIAPELAARVQADAIKADRDLKTTTRTSIVDEKIPSVLADLQARMIVSIGDPNVIPTQYFSAVAAIMADSCKGKFEVGADVIARVMADAVKAEKDLKTTTRLSIVDEKLPSIIGELNARMIVTVSNINAIPGAWFSSLADISAESVKNKFDITPELSVQIASRATRAERVLKNLTRAPIVDRSIDTILADLASRDIVSVVDQTEIPQEWFLHLAAIVADRVKGKGFDIDADTVMRVKVEGAEAMAALRELTRGRPSYLQLQTSYF